MSRFRNPIARRERRQMLWLFATPFLIFAVLLVRLRRTAAPLFPVPPDSQVLESRWNPIYRIGGAPYVQRVQSPHLPSRFWAQTMPLLEAKKMKPDEFHAGPDSNQAEVRNNLQANFRFFGLTQIPRLTTGCAYSRGDINGA